MTCLFRAVHAAVSVAFAADAAARSVFVYRVPRDFLLDILLGPAEEFEHITTVAPTT